MEELLRQCLYQLANEQRNKPDQPGPNTFMEYLVIDECLTHALEATDWVPMLAAKLMAKGVQLPPNHGMIDITHLLD